VERDLVHLDFGTFVLMPKTTTFVVAALLACSLTGRLENKVMKQSKVLEDGLSVPLTYRNSTVDQESSTLATPSKSLSLSTATNISNGEDHFSACLFLMDDNHFLVEWLAYHYTVLPLRRLIVTIDRKSETSPMEIFDRYKDLIDISFLDLQDYYWVDASEIDHDKSYNGDYTEEERANSKVWAHRKRQAKFQSTCLFQLRKEKKRWVTNVDTDERIIVNNEYAASPLPNKRPTLLETLEDPENQQHNPLLNEACIVMPRYHFGPKEEADESKLHDSFPSNSDLNPRDLHTYRWRYRRSFSAKPLPGKSIVNLDMCKARLLRKSNPHRLVTKACRYHPEFDRGQSAPFVVNHYTGTWEQFSFRHDPREKTKSQESFQILANEHTTDEDDNARGWLEDFIGLVGLERAQYLLKGANELWEKTLTPRDHLVTAIDINPGPKQTPSPDSHVSEANVDIVSGPKQSASSETSVSDSKVDINPSPKPTHASDTKLLRAISKLHGI